MQLQAPSYLSELISHGEGLQLDFKFAINDSRKIAISLSAFANTKGGRLLIGVKDNGRIAGVRSDEEFYMIEAANDLYLNRPLSLTVVEHEVEGKKVLEVVVPEDQVKGIKAQDIQRKSWAYIRHLDQNLLASPVHLELWRYASDTAPKKRLSQKQIVDGLKIIENFPTGISLENFQKNTGLQRRRAAELLARFIYWNLVDTHIVNGRILFTSADQ
ncbi:AlbA family DNA-binding domain-containing protein [Schleiferia thermophila]|jgi:predicted HTH transcriptional regulator|uniref:AlbA family DNA-binding domain-containing protein n=1 Tax=Schleiferia thermophila TaxID=884107 RepID=UPI0004E6C8F1|nr:ATP-binding protein [Schleiferia thermophila]KFD38938.1 ATP-dependent DNA helicase [Schleiferia thermophila str. Yellowstone]PMB16081.1 ATP-binding protein [Fischerella thermalis CCMEE 5319]